MRALVILFALVVLISPAFAQAPLPRYPVTTTRITDIRQEAEMFKEFGGNVGLVGVSKQGSIGLFGRLNVGEDYVNISFTDAYLGEKEGTGSLIDVQYFNLDYILVAQDTVKAGALFYAHFTYTDSQGRNIILTARIFPSGRMMGVMGVGDEYAFLMAPTSGDDFMKFIEDTHVILEFAFVAADDPIAILTQWCLKTLVLADPKKPIA